MRNFFQILRARSYRRKIFVYCLLLSVTPVLILGMISSHTAATSIQDEVDARHETVLKQMQYQMNLFFNSITKSSMLIASNRTISKTFDVGPSMRHLDLSLDMIKLISEYRVAADVDFDISLVYSRFGTVYSNRYGLISYTEFPYRYILDRMEFRFNDFNIVPPNDYMESQDFLLVQGIPISYPPFKGYLVMHVKTEQLIDFLQQLNSDNDKKIMIVDANNRILLSSDPGDMGTTVASLAEIRRLEPDSEVYRGQFRHDRQLYSMAALKSSINNWTYVTLTPIEALTGKSQEIRRLTWTIVGLLLVIWLILVGFASNRIYVPIQRLMARLPLESKGKADKADLQMLDAFMYQMVKANQDMQRRLKEHAPIVKENFHQKLLWGDISHRDLQRYEGGDANGLTGPWFAVAVTEIDQTHTLVKKYPHQDISLLYYALRKVAEETCEQHGVSAIVSSVYRQVVLIVESRESNGGTEAMLEKMLARLRENVEQYLKFTVTVAVSRLRKGLHTVGPSYREAVGFINYRLFLGHNTTIMPDHIQPALKQSGLNLVKLQKSIAASVVQNEPEQARRTLAEMVEAVPHVVRDSESAFGLFVYIIGEIASIIQEMGYDPRQIVDDDLNRRLYEMNTLREIERWFADSVFPAIIGKMKQLQISEQKRRIGQIKRLIDEQFESGVSLKQVAAHFGMSQSQLSRLFKEEMNESFSDYLMRLRMNKARDWLQYTDMPIKTIAEKLTYTSVQNFTRSFKQIHHMPPAQYREHSRKQRNGPDSREA